MKMECCGGTLDPPNGPKHATWCLTAEAKRLLRTIVNKATNVPVTINFDQTKVIGEATVYEDGRTEIVIVPSERSKPFYDSIRDGVLTGFSLSYSLHIPRLNVEELDLSDLTSVEDDAMMRYLRDNPPIRRPVTKIQQGARMSQKEQSIRLYRAAALVEAYVKSKLEKTDPVPEFDTYLVWFCYILGGWKALVSTSLPDGMYYEVTYNAAAGETYLDAYKKFDNVRYSDQDQV